MADDVDGLSGKFANGGATVFLHQPAPVRLDGVAF